jgi:hypothetical protein
MEKPVKTILGFLQGAIIAAVIALGLSFAIKAGTIATWISMPLAGVLVGITCGLPIWKEGAWATNVVKAIFGLLLGLGANWLLDFAASAITLPNTLNFNGSTDSWQLGNHWAGVGLFGGLWGLLVGLDSGFDDTKPEANKTNQKK